MIMILTPWQLLVSATSTLQSNNHSITKSKNSLQCTIKQSNYRIQYHTLKLSTVLLLYSLLYFWQFLTTYAFVLTCSSSFWSCVIFFSYWLWYCWVGMAGVRLSCCRACSSAASERSLALLSTANLLSTSLYRKFHCACLVYLIHSFTAI